MLPAALHRPLRFSAIASGIALASACASPPPPQPFAPPASTIQLKGFHGSPLTGTADERDPQTRMPEVLDVTKAPLVRISVFALEAHAGPVLESLPANTRLVADLRGSTPIDPISGVTRSGRVGTGASAREFVQTLDPLGNRGPAGKLGRRAVALPAVHALVPRGCTASAQLVPPGSPATETVIGQMVAPSPGVMHASPGSTTAKAVTRLAVQVHRPRTADPDNDNLLVAVSVSAPAVSANPTAIQGECVLLENRLSLDGSPLVLVLPSPFAEVTKSYVVLLESWSSSLTQSAHQQSQREAAAAQMQADLAADATRTAGDEPIDSARLTWATAVESLRLVDDNRAALVFLAERQQASLASDLAISADRRTLTEFVASHLASGGTVPLDPNAQVDTALGFAIETNALRFLAERADNEPLPPRLDALLIARVGALARYPDGVLEVLAQSSTLEDLDERLLAENRNTLTDSDPSTRVRAFDWLEAKGLGPAGFDPLGDRDSRRTALKAANRAAEDAAEQAALEAQADSNPNPQLNSTEQPSSGPTATTRTSKEESR